MRARAMAVFGKLTSLKCFDTLRMWRQPAFGLWGPLAGKPDRRCRQNFAFSRKPMLIGLPMYAAICGPDLISSFANSSFQALIHVRVPADWLSATAESPASDDWRQLRTLAVPVLKPISSE